MQIFIVTTVAFLLSTLTGNAQTLEWAIKPKYEAAGTFYDGIAPAKFNGLWGFINKSGDWVIQPTIKNIKPYRGGLIGISDGELWGYINKSGKEITGIAYVDVAMSQEDRGAHKGTDGTWNIINEEGRPLTEHIFYSAPIFSEGYAPVKRAGGWGFVDKSGKNFQHVRGAARLFRLSEGLAVFVEGKKRGYVNASGKKVIPAKYHRARRFSNGHAAVSNGPGADWTLINKRNANVFSSEPHFMVREFADDVVPVQTLKEPLTWVFVDEDGYGVNGWEGPFEAAYSFKEGFALVKRGGQFNFLTLKGEYALNTWFDDAFAFNESMSPVKRGNQWGYLKIKDATDEKIKKLMSQAFDLRVEKKYEEAHSLYLEAANLGDPRAQNTVGFNLAAGTGIPQDMAKAKTWFEKSHGQNYEQASFNLGQWYLGYYFDGPGVAELFPEHKDIEKALFYLNSAARSGNSTSMQFLGRIYEHGNDVEIDYQKSLYWYQKEMETSEYVSDVDVKRVEKLIKDGGKKEILFFAKKSASTQENIESYYLEIKNGSNSVPSSELKKLKKYHDQYLIDNLYNLWKSMSDLSSDCGIDNVGDIDFKCFLFFKYVKKNDSDAIPYLRKAVGKDFLDAVRYATIYSKLLPEPNFLELYKKAGQLGDKTSTQLYELFFLYGDLTDL